VFFSVTIFIQKEQSS